ncbi:unnamed protein product [Cladocopium goreaui]|uniref:Uncharacterized protein n=1 Tax=Cladocopium goreaui TaxID=2562237 RepID=A0A9P1FU79_9DINO|nr:unnamed protein product [Cladocopium goreaui]
MSGANSLVESPNLQLAKARRDPGVWIGQCEKGEPPKEVVRIIEKMGGHLRDPMKEVWEHRLPIKLSRSFEEPQGSKQKMSGLHTEVQEEVIRHTGFPAVILDILSRPGMIVRLTCSWGWHRTLGTAGVIIKILQMAGVEVVLYSARLSMAPAVDCSNVIAFLQGTMRTLSQNMYDDITGKPWTDEDFNNALERARNLWREVYPHCRISFREKSVAPPPPGGPPPRDIGPIATASARPPPKPTRPAPKAASTTAPKAEPASASSVKREPSPTASASSVKKEPSSTASASSVKREPSPTAPEPAPKVEEPAPVKEEKIGMPPGLVDELQTMSPAQKKAKLSDPYVREMIQQQISFLQGLLETDVDGGDGWDEVLDEILTDYQIQPSIRAMMAAAKISRSHKIKLMFNMLLRWGNKAESNDWLRRAIGNLASHVMAEHSCFEATFSKNMIDTQKSIFKVVKVEVLVLQVKKRLMQHRHQIGAAGAEHGLFSICGPTELN